MHWPVAKLHLQVTSFFRHLRVASPSCIFQLHLLVASSNCRSNDWNVRPPNGFGTDHFSWCAMPIRCNSFASLETANCSQRLAAHCSHWLPRQTLLAYNKIIQMNKAVLRFRGSFGRIRVLAGVLIRVLIRVLIWFLIQVLIGVLVLEFFVGVQILPNQLTKLHTQA